MPHADVNGQRLYYEDTGGDGAAVVFSHGLFMDHTMFAPQVEALRDRYRCIAWDERGHGRTGDATGPFTYWDSANDLVGILDDAGVERAVLAGMSQGGYLSLRAALAHPERTRALILMDTQATLEDPEKMPLYHQLVERWLTQGMDDELAEIIENIIIGPGYPDAERWKQSWKALTPGNVEQLFSTLAGREDLSDRLAEIDVPALVVHGELDASISVARARPLADGLADAEFVVIDGAGHAANLTDPEHVNPHIERFLAGLD